MVKFGYLDEVKPVFPRSTAGQGINDCSRCAALNRESWLYKQTQSVKFGCWGGPTSYRQNQWGLGSDLA